MADVIQLLPDSIANQIAAGEVVQRPSSVVKELLENAIDAGSTSIELIVSDFGKGLIQVSDNGVGMTETDARLSLERHATSKIRKAEDLFKITSMGFRGEALASIAAVSQLDIVSLRQGKEVGTFISVEASDVKLQEPRAAEQGTSIKVRNLFYNIPARRNFLKSDAVELKHILDEFNHIAIAYPDKEFKYFQDGELVTHLLPGKLSQRIIALFGKQYKEQLAYCEGEMGLIKLNGYVGKPEFAKKTRGDQYIFVNNRFIKSHYINHAVISAFEGLLPEKYYPFFAIFITIDPSQIDINIHPTKTEIKFEDERTIYALIRASVKKALGTHHFSPSLDFAADVNILNQFEQNKAERNYERFQISKRTDSKGSWEQLYSENPFNQRETEQSKDQSEELTFSSGMDVLDLNRNSKNTIFQLDNQFIFTPLKSGLMVINQKAAIECILYESNLSFIEGKKINGQQCLFPVSVSLSPSDYTLVMELKEPLRDLGFDIEPFGKNTIAIQTIPADIVAENEKELLEGLIEQYKHEAGLKISIREKLLRSFAKRATMQKGKKLSSEELEELVNRLFRCKNPNYTPSGKPTFRIIERNTIEGYFK